jgi:predicted esterase YcpF (UPF0227 family)
MTDISIPPVDVGAFYDMLNSHDWLWQSRDDGEEYRDGAEWYAKLQTISEQSDEHKKLFNDFEAHVKKGVLKPEKPK